MKRFMMLVACLMLAFAVQASDTVRFGSQVITVGDSETKVIRVAGKPDQRVKLETKYGGAQGYRLDYEDGNKTIQIYIANGQVVAIAELY